MFLCSLAEADMVATQGVREGAGDRVRQGQGPGPPFGRFWRGWRREGVLVGLKGKHGSLCLGRMALATGGPDS